MLKYDELKKKSKVFINSLFFSSSDLVYLFLLVSGFVYFCVTGTRKL